MIKYNILLLYFKHKGVLLKSQLTVLNLAHFLLTLISIFTIIRFVIPDWSYYLLQTFLNYGLPDIRSESYTGFG